MVVHKLSLKPSFLSSPTRVLISHKNFISGLSKELKQGAI